MPKLNPAQLALVRAQRTSLEDRFAKELEIRKFPAFEREWKFSDKGYRFDFAWPMRDGSGTKIAVEVDGIFGKGGHRNLGRHMRDEIKLNLAAEKRWYVFRYNRKDIEDGSAFRQLGRMLGVAE